jgi:predicted DNA-binding protein (MmcQ/YjbR family)
VDIEALRRYCMGFPHATENMQWGVDLCFKVGGKLFLVTPLEPAPVQLSFKSSPERFTELCERSGVRPAAYLARAQWVSLEKFNTLPDSELRELIAESYQLVWEKLPKKVRLELDGGGGKSGSQTDHANLTSKKAGNNLTSKKTNNNLTGKKITKKARHK